MSCDEAQELLLTHELLSWGRQQALDAHLAACPTCARLRADLRVVRQGLAALPDPAARLDPAASAAIRQRLIARRFPAPTLAAAGPRLALAGLVLVLALLAIWTPRATPISTGSTGERATPSQAAPSGPAPAALPAAQSAQALPHPLTILVLGKDSLASDPDGRADSLLLVRLAEAPHRATVVALPRQLWARYPDGREGRLGAALVEGAQMDDADGGGPFVKATVEQLLEIPIDYYLLMDMQGFVRLIDALGGVTVDIPEALSDPAFPTNGYGTTEVRFEPGPQLLSGADALTYARSRNSDGDFGRDGRQMTLLRGMLADLQQRGVLGQIDLIDDYRRLVSDSIRTDIPPELLLAIARWSAGVDPAAVETLTLERDVDTLPPPATFVLNEAARERLRDRFSR